MRQLLVNELFAGIGAQERALCNLEIPHKIVGISEIDKWCVKSYNATCYGLGLGIDYILFFYEDRNFCSKKPYLWKITDEMKDEVIRKIHRVNSYLHRREAPPADKDKCTYCRYKEACKRLENAQREREIADTYIPPVGEEGWFNG